MELLTVLRANIRHKKGAFKSIIILSALIVFAFLVTASNSDSIDRSLEEAHRIAKTPTFTALANRAKMPEDMAEKLLSHDQVTAVRMTDCVGVDSIEIDGKGLNQLTLFYRATEPLYRIFQGEGTLEPGEILVPYPMTATEGVKLGSVISFGDGQKFTVAGFVEEPFLGAAPIGTKRMFVCDSDFDRLQEAATVGYLGNMVDIGIDLASGADFVAVKRDLNRSCGLVDNSIITLSRAETEGYTKIYSDIASKILNIFAGLLTAIVMIAICHSITVSMEMEYVNLGILKGLGFTAGKLRLIYLLQYLLAELIGTVLGMILSVPALSAMNRLFMTITGILTTPRISLWKGALLTVGLLGLTAVFVVLATGKAGKIAPVRAISGGKGEVFFHSRLNVPVKGKPLTFYLGLRQFTSRLKSYGGSVCIVALLVYFMMTVTVLSQRISGEFSLGSLTPHITAYMEPDFDMEKMKDVEQTVLDADPEARALFIFGNYIMADGIEIQCSGISRPEELYRPIDGRLPIYDNEVAVTEISGALFGKGIGDTLLLGGENPREYLITGTYQGFNDAGKTILITAEGRYRLDGTIPVFGAELSDVARLDEVEQALYDRFGADIRYTERNEEVGGNSGMEDFLTFVCDMLVAIIYTVSIVFAAVVVGMVCNKSFIRERTDIGILRSLGMTVTALRWQFSIRFLLVAVAGSILGGLASAFGTAPLLVAILRMVGLTRMENGVTAAGFLLPAGLICVSFFLFSYVVSGKIRQVAVRELIME